MEKGAPLLSGICQGVKPFVALRQFPTPPEGVVHLLSGPGGRHPNPSDPTNRRSSALGDDEALRRWGREIRKYPYGSRWSSIDLFQNSTQICR